METIISEKTPMCLINELARYNKTTHQYRLTDESGPAHKKSFTVCLKLGGSSNNNNNGNNSSADASSRSSPSSSTSSSSPNASTTVVAEEYIASGPSIKKAQHAAAAIALERTALRHPPPKTKVVKNGNGKN